MKIYSNVHVLDYHSLYPSLIRQLRLSPEHKYSINYRDNPNTNLVINKDELTEETGILDGYITELLELRKEYRKQGKEHEQQAIKIITNSVYGLLSQKTAKFIFGGTHIAATVTYVGRTLLQTLINKLPEYGITVVYGKTDSIFVIDDKNQYTKEEILEIAQRITNETIEELTGLKNEFVKFDYQEYLTKFLIVNKNNYVKQYPDGSIKKKGASFYNKKTSNFENDLINLLVNKALENNMIYSKQAYDVTMDFMNNKLKDKDVKLDYYAIKHKPRKQAINKWDDISYLEQHNMDISYGFYYNAVIVDGYSENGVLLFPLGGEVVEDYRVSRKWLKQLIMKNIKKLEFRDGFKQQSLDIFF